MDGEEIYDVHETVVSFKLFIFRQQSEIRVCLTWLLRYFNFDFSIFLRGVCFSFSVFFWISFWEIQKLDGPKRCF
jgi:hypothetical protein